MTDVVIRWRTPRDPRGVQPGSVTFTPSARYRIGVELVEASPTSLPALEPVQVAKLDPCGPDWCWIVTWRPEGAPAVTEYVRVPDTSDPVEYVDLEQLPAPPTTEERP